MPKDNTSDDSGSSPWMTEDHVTTSDFVLVTRPLDSIRLADVWLRREGLPNAHDAAHNMRVTAIRRDIYGLEDEQSKNKQNNKKDANASTSSGTLSPLTPNASDECTLLIDQQSFLRDMLKAFTAKATFKASSASAASAESTFCANATSGSSPTGTTGDANTAAAVDTYVANASTSSSAGPTAPPAPTTPSAMITEQQWTKIWQQFNADIGRELFCIENKRYTDADAAYQALSQLFEAFEDDWLAYQAAVGEASAPSLVRRVSGMVWNTATLPFSLAMGIVTAPARLLRAALTKSTGTTAGNTTTAAAQPKKVAPADPLLCEGLARFVVLLSQQSVLAFPYELLHHQFVGNTDNIFVGEIRTFCLPGTDEDFDEDEATLQSSMKVNVKRYPTTVKEEAVTPKQKAAKAPVAVPVPTPEPSRDGVACSTSPMAPPIPGTSFPAASLPSANAQYQAPTKKSVTAPFVVLTVSKEFRVFALDESNDHTLFHIVANVSVDVTNATDPVSVSWSLKPTPRRGDRPTDSKLQFCGLGAQARAAAAANEPPSYAVVAQDPHRRASAPQSPASPLMSSSPSTAAASPSSPMIVAGAPSPTDSNGEPRDPSAPPRLCDCLGGSMGFHRAGCPLHTNA